MPILLDALKFIAIIVAAIVLGNMFLAELRKSNRKGDPWYRPYLSLPGLLILFGLFGVPVIVWLYKQ